MTRMISRALLAGVFAALLGGTMLSTQAMAYPKVVARDQGDDGSTMILLEDANVGHQWLVIISKDGKLEGVYIVSNPNPDDNTTGPGSHTDKPDVAQMIKLGDVTYKVRIAPADSVELISHLRGSLRGGGLGPRYNPGDDDDGHGHGDAPDHSMEVKKTQDEINQEIATANAVARQLAALGGAMGDGDEGGGESPGGFNKNGSGKDPGDDQGDYTEGQNKDIGKTETGLLGAKPELVNPPHWERTGSGEHGAGRTGTGAGAGHGGVGGGTTHG
jgi:hypothetical protein